MEKRQLIGTTTIVIVLFTILLLGGSTMPLIRLVDIEDARARRRSKKDVNLSKTEKMVGAAEGLWPVYLGGRGGLLGRGLAYARAYLRASSAALRTGAGLGF